MSAIFLRAILRPEIAAPILWAPGIFGSFCWKAPMPIKYLLLAKGGVGSGFVFERGGGGGGSANFIFMGAGIFLNFVVDITEIYLCLGAISCQIRHQKPALATTGPHSLLITTSSEWKARSSEKRIQCSGSSRMFELLMRLHCKSQRSLRLISSSLHFHRTNTQGLGKPIVSRHG